jgi:hypothetical protein
MRILMNVQPECQARMQKLDTWLELDVHAIADDLQMLKTSREFCCRLLISQS